MTSSRYVALAAVLLALAGCEPPRPLPTAPVPVPQRELASAPATGHRSSRQELAATESFIELRAPAAADVRPDSASSYSATGGAFSAFVEFNRYSVEANDWFVVMGDSAYYRDLSMAVVQFFDHPGDGDTWTLQATLPDGSLFNYASVTYHTSWNGATDCFVASSGQSVCNQTSVYVYANKQIQCGQTGIWRFRMAYNGVQYDQRQLKVVAAVDERYVPLLAQGGTAWRSNLYDHSCTVYKLKNGTLVRSGADCLDSDPAHHTIWGRGCAITSATMVMGYHQALSDPGTVNEWLRANDGYAYGGATIFQRVARFAKQVGAPQFNFDQSYNTSTSATTLKGLICKYGPQEIAVRGTSHFVVAFGYDDVRGTFLIHDPAGGVSTTLAAYGNVFNGIRLMTGPEKTVTLFSGIRFSFHSPVDVVVTNPLGQRVGSDPRTGATYAEIPGGIADSTFLDDDEVGGLAADESVKGIGITSPAAGAYTVTVVGTATGSYSAQITTVGNDEAQQASTLLVDVPTTPGEVHSYQFNYDPAAAAAAIVLRGAFQGGGQRDEVDDLLTYASPVERQTTLPAGTTSTRVRISYAGGIVGSSLQAMLETVDVRSQFHPLPSTSETVLLPLHVGRNVLKLSIQGLVGGRTATDQDQLVFIVK